MASTHFKDRQGKRWRVRVDVASIARIRELAGVDFSSPRFSDEVAAIISDPVKIAAVIYAACKPDADTVGMSPEAFGGAIAAASVIEAAYTALVSQLRIYFKTLRTKGA